MPPAASLPIDDVLRDIVEVAADCGRVVVAAAPGSGKTTRVPLALRDAVGGRVVVLQPRRVAARSAARFLAARLGERVGATIGLTTRDEHLVSDATTVEFVTEGVLTRRLQRDPELPGVTTVVFDEFHERSLNTDLGLALTLDAAAGVRPDLRIVIMSATLDSAAVCALLEPCQVIEAPGRLFPVDTHYRPYQPTLGLDAAMAIAIGEAQRETDGDVLAFLPGAAEIRRLTRRLDTERTGGYGTPLDVRPLHGQLSAADQDHALAPGAAGRRKVVLATNVAETSLTVEGVTAVVDSGLVRRFRMSASEPFGRLVTERVSQAEAAQRRGRAGRLTPGACFRLWARTDHSGLSPAPRPEMLTADLTGLAFELAGWGIGDAAALRWLDRPPPENLERARSLLRHLGLLDPGARPTETGRAVLRLGIDPRIGAMVLAGQRRGATALRRACALAALIEEGDVFTGRTDRLTVDIDLRLDALGDELPPERTGRRPATGSDRGRDRGRDRPLVLADDVVIPEGRRRRILRRADLLEQRARRLGPPGTPDSSTVLDSSAVLLLAGMSDRIAQRRGDGGGRYVLRHGGSVRLDPDDPLARHPFLLIAAAGGTRGPAAGAGTSGAGAAFPGAGRAGATEGIDLAARLAVALPTALLPGGDTMLNVFWDPGLGEDGDVSARVVERLDALELRSRPASDADLTADLVIDALLDGVRHRGFVLLGRVAEARSLQHRVAFCRRELGEDWPDLSDETLLADLRGWLEPFLAGSRRRRDLQQVDTRAAWFQLLSRPQQASIDRMAPAEVTIPTGRRVRLDYQPDQPVLAVKVQELFGLAQLPTLADGRSRIMAHLLSPAGRPVAVTDDLARFWANGYREVRTELRGRYPKHPWPEDPLSAPATAATRRAQAAGRADPGQGRTRR